MSGKERGLLLLALALPALVLALVLAHTAPPERDPTHAEFQRLVGGLGFGPAVDLSRCGHAFDPRVAPDCSGRHEPVPCGSRFCPFHSR